MMKKLLATTSLAACAIAASPAFAGGDCGGAGLGDANLNELNPYYYTGGVAGTTASGIPHLPAYHGQMQTNSTYRFFNVNEMVATMVGEGKHGLWRTQDNGTVREYLTAAAKAANVGLAAGEDPNSSASFDDASEWANYSHSDAADSWGGYVADGNLVNGDGNQAYVDLPISHPKYAGAYSSHTPIDLPSWYCTMSGPEYKNARAAVRFAFGQAGANEVGPLGARAGLDVKENYLNILRLDLFPDASAWVNTTGDTDQVDYEAIDTDRTPAEYYLVERPFFNEEYLFIIAVFADNKKHGRNFSYIRPDGAYYEHLMDRYSNGEDLPWFNTRLPKRNPKFAVESNESAHNNWGYDHNRKGKKRATQTNLYGVHHPDTGACPAIGGDFGASYYGGSWPNTYQEITPLCDAVMLDIKLWTNLDGEDWTSEGKYLANATVNGAPNTGDRDGDGNALTRGHTDVPGVYGAFSDPYLTDRGIQNPEQFTATGTQNKQYKTSQEAVSAEDSAPFVPSL